MGIGTRATNHATFTCGKDTKATGQYSSALGHDTIANNTNMHAQGQYNIGTAETIHETGIGADAANRANAFEIYIDGRIHAPELTTSLVNNPRSLTTKEYVDAFAGGSVSINYYMLAATVDTDGVSGDYFINISIPDTPQQSLDALGAGKLDTDSFFIILTGDNTTDLNKNITYIYNGSANSTYTLDNPFTVNTSLSSGAGLFQDYTWFINLDSQNLETLSQLLTPNAPVMPNNYDPLEDNHLVTKHYVDRHIKESYEETATAGQTDFIVSNKIFAYAEVYTNGLKIKNSAIVISDNGTDTTVTIPVAAANDDIEIIF